MTILGRRGIMQNEQNKAKGIFKEFIYVFNLNKERNYGHPWSSSYVLSEEEKNSIASSVQQFQLGESSDGKEFLERARKFSEQCGDDSYVNAVRLFIAEEQRHSEMLGKFLGGQGIAPIDSHWVDWCFRRLRRIAGAGTAATVLVTAELIARPYYRALRGATHSPLLSSICQQIIEEEEIHIEFQAASVALMCLYQPSHLRCFFQILHQSLMEIACRIAWREHKAVFKAGNYTFEEFHNECAKGVKEFHVLCAQKLAEFQDRFEGRILPLHVNMLQGN